MATTQRAVDIVIVGAGMAGLIAAIEGLEHDRDVLVLEKGPRAGGSMYLSAGIIYTYDSVERVREEIPHGNPELQQIIVERKDEDLQWLSSLGFDLQEPSGDVTFGSGKQVDPKPFTEELVARVEATGGELLLETPMIDLVESDGGVAGVVAESSDGSQLQISADAVVLATGGFQGNESLVEQYITDAPENMWLRANPWSTGDGLAAAAEVGGKTAGTMRTFYGHNLPAPPAEIPPSMLLDAKQAYGVKAIAIDDAGERFVDESASPYEVVLTQETARRADGRAYYVVDEELYHSKFESRVVSASIQTAEELGGRVAEVESLPELESKLFDWGANGEQAIETIRTFNAAVENRDGHSLDPPRTDHQTAIDEPPYYVVEVQPGITFTMGGLDVTGDMEVLRTAGTSSSLSHIPESPASVRMTPISGLYAAGADVGNVMNEQYMGGLATALVTGRIAGNSAAH